MELLIILAICCFLFGGSSSSKSSSRIFRNDRSNSVKNSDYTPKRHNWCDTDYHGRPRKK